MRAPSRRNWRGAHTAALPFREPLGAGDERLGLDVRLAADTDGDALVGRELATRLESELACEQRIVTDERMPVQREMRCVHGDVIRHEGVQTLVRGADDALRSAPEHP